MAVVFSVLGTFPKAFSQAATSQVCPSRSAPPACSSHGAQPLAHPDHSAWSICSLHIVRSTRFLLFEIDRVFVNVPIIFKLTNLFILYFFNKKIIREEPLNPRVLHLIGIRAYHNLWEVAAWERNIKVCLQN